MAQQDIIIGAENAKGGDSLFSAFTKTQANFTDLYAGLGAQANNLITVNQESDFPVQDATTITLSANTLFFIGAQITTSKRFILETGANITSIGPFSLVLIYTGIDAMFTTSGTSAEITSIGLSCTNGTLFDFSGAGQIMLISDMFCYEADKIGSITNNNLVWNNSGVINIGSQGLNVNGTIARLSMQEINFQSANSGISIVNLTGSTLSTVEIVNMDSDIVSGSYLLQGDAGSINIETGQIALVSSCEITGGGDALNVITGDDSGYDFRDVTGVDDSKTIGHAYIATGDEATTTINSGVEVPVNGTFTQGGVTSQATVSAAGVITMGNRIGKRGTVTATLDIDKAGGGNDDYIFRVKKVPISTGVEEEVEGAFTTKTMGGGDTDTATMIAPVRYIEGDYFLVTVESVGTNDNITANTQGFEVSD